jgi:hypothetical protein
VYVSVRVARSGLAVTAIIIAIVVTMLATMIWINWPSLDAAVGIEEAPVAWLSSSLLVAGSVTALNAAPTGNRLAWLALCALLLVMAVDERFMGHERLRDWLAVGAWGNTVLLAYPAAGAPIVRALLREIPQTRARALILAGVVIAAVAIALDIAFEIMILQILEELLEVLAETLFLCGLLEALRARMKPI